MPRGGLTAHTWGRMAGGEDGCRRPTASFPRFEDQLEAIAEMARRAGVFIEPVKYDWNPYVMVAHMADPG